MISSERNTKQARILMEELTLDNYSLESYIEGRKIENISVENLHAEKGNVQNCLEEQTGFTISAYFINSIVYFNICSDEVESVCEVNDIDNITVNSSHYDNKFNLFRVFEIHKIYCGNRVKETVKSQLDDVEVISSDNEDMSNKQLPKRSKKKCKVSDLGKLDNISFINTPRVDILFPGYTEAILLGIINYVGIRTLEEVIWEKRNNIMVRIFDILKVFMTNSWLNDVIINFYINLLIEKSKDKILAFNSYFFYDITNIGFYKYLINRLNNAKIFEYKKIIIPTHLSNLNHWTLIVVEPQTKVITYFDSFLKLNNFDSFSRKISFLVGFLNMAYRAQKHFIPMSTWKIKCGNSPLQDNMNDCGVYVCTNARYAIYNKPLNYSQEDILLLRQRITYEILLGKVFPTQ